MATPNIVPRADSEGGLGTASKYWASAYIDFVYVGAGKIGRDTDNLLDFSVDNQLTFRLNGSQRVAIDSANMYPLPSDGMALGHASYRWSDLFLASGAVINFDNGDVTLTHSTSTITSTGHIAINDSKRLKLGNSHDLEIYHAPDHSYISNQTGTLYITNTADDNDIVLQCDDGSGGTTPYITLDGSAGSISVAKTLLCADNKGINIGASNDLQISHNGSNSGTIKNTVGNLTISNEADDGDISFQSDNGSGGVTEYFRLDGGIKRTIFTENIGLEDNTQILIGSGNDLQIYHDATDSYIKNSHGNLLFRNNKQNKDILFQGDDGQASDDTVATYFFLDGSSATHDGSATTALYTNWPDYSRISMGTSHDLQIYHSGDHSYMHSLTGNLYITNFADNGDIIFENDNGSGGTTTYFRLDGGLSSPFTVFPDNSAAAFGSGFDLRFFHDSNHSYISQQGTGNLYIRNLTDDADIVFQSDDGSGGTTTYFTIDGSAHRTYFQKNIRMSDGSQIQLGDSGDLQIYHDATDSIISNSTGDLVIKNNANDKDVKFQCDNGDSNLATYFFLDGSLATHDGSATTALSTVWPDNSKVVVGDGADGRYWHDGSHTYLQNTTGDLIIQNFADDKDIILKSDDGSGGTTAYLTIDGSSTITQVHKNLRVDDSIQLQLGTGSDLRLYHDGTDSQIKNVTGDLKIEVSADDKNITFRNDDGSGAITTYLQLNGSEVSTKILTQKVIMTSLPTSDPSNAGQLWNDSGTLKISAG